MKKQQGLMSVFLPQHTLHPRDHFMRRRVRGLVEVYDAGADVGLQVTIEGVAADGDGGKVTSANHHCRTVSGLIFQQIWDRYAYNWCSSSGGEAIRWSLLLGSQLRVLWCSPHLWARLS